MKTHNNYWYIKLYLGKLYRVFQNGFSMSKLSPPLHSWPKHHKAGFDSEKPGKNIIIQGLYQVLFGVLNIVVYIVSIWYFCNTG